MNNSVRKNILCEIRLWDGEYAPTKTDIMRACRPFVPKTVFREINEMLNEGILTLVERGGYSTKGLAIVEDV